MAPLVQLDDRQQRLAYIGAGVAAVGLVAARAADLPDSIPLVALGLAMAAFLAFAARRRSVVLTGAAAFVISFGPWGDVLWFLGAPYIAFGGLLMYRASKQAAEAAGPREARKKKEKTDAAPPAKKAPDRSKRYTPPSTRSKRTGGT